MKQKFTAPAAPGRDYTPIQTTAPEQQTPADEKAQFYRFNVKMPYKFHDYLQEMAWRNRVTITDYLNRIIQKDMDAHPEWEETVDILNK